MSAAAPQVGDMTTIFTIGYEGATVDGFLATLKAAGVERLIDVRALPLSRRPGFSKSPLAAALKEVGIDYVHLKDLGTPKRGRDAAKKGDVGTLREVYDDQLALPEAQAAAARMLDLAGRSQRAALFRARSLSLPPDAVAGGGGAGGDRRRSLRLTAQAATVWMKSAVRVRSV